VPIPDKTLHAADHRLQRAGWLIDRRRHAEAEDLLRQTPGWHYHGLEYCRSLASAQRRQRLYDDALITAIRCVNWPESDYAGTVKLVVEHMGSMLSAYRSLGRLTPGKLAGMSSLLRSLRGRYSDPSSLEKAVQILNGGRSFLPAASLDTPARR
jgi:hypothetical protein